MQMFMTPQEIHQELQTKFPGVELKFEQKAGEPFIIVPNDTLAAVCRTLKTDPKFEFNCLMCIAGVDYKDYLESVYHLYSYARRHRLVLKARATRDNPKIPTVEGIWKTANWLERESYDLVGIVYEGHSDLRRIMNPDDWPGHPLRKDYIEAADYHGIETTRESLLITGKIN